MMGTRSRNATVTSQADALDHAEDTSVLMPGGLADASIRSGRQRSYSGKALSAFQVSSPTYESRDDVVLSLDWKGMYRDRLELERRWAEGKFAKRTLKGHEVSTVATYGHSLRHGCRIQCIVSFCFKTSSFLAR